MAHFSAQKNFARQRPHSARELYGWILASLLATPCAGLLRVEHQN